MKFISRDIIKSQIIFSLVFAPLIAFFGFAFGMSNVNIFLLIDILIIYCLCVFSGTFFVKIFYVRNEYLLALLTGSMLISIIALLIWFSVIYTKHGIVDASGTVINDFWTCFYFSVVTFVTLGYGDFTPTEDVRIVAALEALIGYLCLGLLIATFIVVIRKQVERKHKQQ